MENQYTQITHHLMGPYKKDSTALSAKCRYILELAPAKHFPVQEEAKSFCNRWMGGGWVGDEAPRANVNTGDGRGPYTVNMSRWQYAIHAMYITQYTLRYLQYAMHIIQ